MKLGIIIGHNNVAKGASGADPINTAEYDYNGAIAEIMDDASIEYGIDGKIFRRKKSTSYIAEIRDVYSRADKWRADATIELHFNAFNTKVMGTETLTGPSENAYRTGVHVHLALVELYNRGVAGDRGIKPYRPGIRGGASLISGKAPAILVEPFFGDNIAEAQLAHAVGKEALAKAYLSGISAAWPATLGATTTLNAREFSHAR